MILEEKLCQAEPKKTKKKQKKPAKYWYKTFLLKHMLRFSI